MGWFYQCIKWSGRIALPIFYQKLEVKGLEHLREKQPFILAPNHQNAFMDAILVGSYVPKEVSFLTRSDVFVSPYDIILHSLNMVPVYRIRDGYEQLKKNEETFALCDRRLENDSPILIFPEGNMGEGFHLRPTSKGTARMAIQSQEKINKDLLIVPVGINYNHHDNPRSGVSLIFGNPINVNHFVKKNEVRHAKLVLLLKIKIEQAIKEVMLLPEQSDLTEQSKKILGQRYKSKTWAEKKVLLANTASLQASKLLPSLRLLTKLLSIPNLIPHFIIDHVINDLKDQQFILSLKYILGLVLFPLWWITILLFLWSTLGITWAFGCTIAVIVSLFLRQGVQNMIR